MIVLKEYDEIFNEHMDHAAEHDSKAAVSALLVLAEAIVHGSSEIAASLDRVAQAIRCK